MAEIDKTQTSTAVAKVEKLPLPKGWTRQVKAAVVRVISLAQLSLTVARGKMVDGVADSASETAHRQAVAVETDRWQQELALALEEMRIKDARWGRVPPQRRPHYTAVKRLAILQLRAARGWSLAQTAERFFVTLATIASWSRRLDDDGVDGLLVLRQPVNKFPNFVRYTVQRLKVLCPTFV